MDIKSVVKNSLQHFTSSSESITNDSDNLSALIGFEGIFLQHFFDKILTNEILNPIMNLGNSSSKTANNKSRVEEIQEDQGEEENDDDKTPAFNVTLVAEDQNSSSSSVPCSVLEVIDPSFIESVSNTLFETIVLERQENENEEEVDTRELMSSLVSIDLVRMENVVDDQEQELQEEDETKYILLRYWSKYLIHLSLFEKIAKYRLEVKKGRIFSWFDDLRTTLLLPWLSSFEKSDDDNEHENENQHQQHTQMLQNFPSVQQMFVETSTRILKLFVENLLEQKSSSSSFSPEKIFKWKKLMTQTVLQLTWLDFVVTSTSSSSSTSLLLDNLLKQLLLANTTTSIINSSSMSSSLFSLATS